jgi:hypothetical protein
MPERSIVLLIKSKARVMSYALIALVMNFFRPVFIHDAFFKRDKTLGQVLEGRSFDKQISDDQNLSRTKPILELRNRCEMDFRGGDYESSLCDKSSIQPLVTHVTHEDVYPRRQISSWIYNPSLVAIGKDIHLFAARVTNYESLLGMDDNCSVVADDPAKKWLHEDGAIFGLFDSSLCSVSLQSVHWKSGPPVNQVWGRQPWRYGRGWSDTRIMSIDETFIMTTQRYERFNPVTIEGKQIWDLATSKDGATL